jgi:hypothetical protein
MRREQRPNLKRCSLVLSTLLALSILLISGCGIYAIDEALKAPYNLSQGLLELTFYGDDEDHLTGYNLWYKESEYDFYQRCYYDTELNTPTIPKKGGSTEEYTVTITLLSPLGGKSFSEIHSDEGSSFYFAVSAYGVGIAESGKAEFGLWP